MRKLFTKHKVMKPWRKSEKLARTLAFVAFVTVPGLEVHAQHYKPMYEAYVQKQISGKTYQFWDLTCSRNIRKTAKTFNTYCSPTPNGNFWAA